MRIRRSRKYRYSDDEAALQNILFGDARAGPSGRLRRAKSLRRDAPSAGGDGTRRDRRRACSGPGKKPSPPPEETEPPPDTPSPAVEVIPPDDTLVRLTDHIPDILIDLKYAAADNFTGAVIYDFTDAYLRYGTVKKLAGVQEELRKAGMVLKIWDAFRPVSAQFKLWEVCPDPTYVANPYAGYSSHSTGNTVDLTLAYSDGTEVRMPTGFDDFSPMADRDYGDCDEVSAENARSLEDLMSRHGFVPYYGEWWHFSDGDAYAVETAFEPSAS